jgi:hypothetical protein
MNISNLVFLGILFFLLTPNILLRLPQNGSKYVVAGVHAVVFGILYYVICLLLKRTNILRDGFTDDQCIEGDEDDDGPYMLDENNMCVPSPQN